MIKKAYEILKSALNSDGDYKDLVGIYESEIEKVMNILLNECSNKETKVRDIIQHVSYLADLEFAEFDVDKNNIKYLFPKDDIVQRELVEKRYPELLDRIVISGLDAQGRKPGRIIFTIAKEDEEEEEYNPCEGCQAYDGGYNCKHCEEGDDGKYSIYDIYRKDELV